MQTIADYNFLKELSDKYGDSFYLFYPEVFEENFRSLKNAFESVYPRVKIAYSYKTNYMPALVRLADSLGTYAEIVSDMELDLALKAGVDYKHIIWNGPVKDPKRLEAFLLEGGLANIDSVSEAEYVSGVARDHGDQKIRVGIRLNFDCGDGCISRFGIDTESGDLDKAVELLTAEPNIEIESLQIHFAKRDPGLWRNRAEGIVKVYDRLKKKFGVSPVMLDLGGGIYGRMPESLQDQLGTRDVTFDDYADISASVIKGYFDHCEVEEDNPFLFLEPGTALSANCMSFVCSVKAIKTVRGKSFATLSGSQKNINMSGVNPPIHVVRGNDQSEEYSDLDMVGYTCIEGDVLQRGYCGDLSVGDFIVIDNCGSYSVVMKPPFIFPNVPVLECRGQAVREIKRAEDYGDLMHTYV